MHPGVIAIVLCAALLHAGWNAMLKSSGDRLASLSLMTIGAGVAALPMIIFTPLPPAAAWPYIIISGVLHTGYNLFLIQAYRIGDFSQSYPIARGSSPLLVSCGAALFVGEQMHWYVWLGIALVSVGIISLANFRNRQQLSAPAAAFATGAFIAAYTVTDGLGTRATGDALTYSGWLFVLNSIPLALIYISQQGRFPRLQKRRDSWISVTGGVMSLAAYTIVIWAVMHAPMGTVSALRETSVLFAALIGAIFFKERLTRRRIGACLLITAGAVVLGWHY